jgi:hypothetical protein
MLVAFADLSRFVQRSLREEQLRRQARVSEN